MKKLWQSELVQMLHLPFLAIVLGLIGIGINNWCYSHSAAPQSMSGMGERAVVSLSLVSRAE